MKDWFLQQLQQSTSLYALWLAFNRRTQRERILLLLGGACLVLLLLFYGVWKSSYQQRLAAEERLSQANAQYQLLLVNAEKLATPQDRGVQLLDRDATELLQIVNQTASQTQFTADRINFEGQSGLQIWASDISFGVVSAWLRVLAKQQVMIEEFQFERVSAGQVNVRLTLN